MVVRNGFFSLLVGATVIGCVNNKPRDAGPAPSGTSGVVAGVRGVGVDPALPADAEHVAARLASSPRHGEWALVHTTSGDSVKVWIEYPERRTRAPVVLVIHENGGLSTWARGVADQLAAAGFIAIAPDLLTMSGATRTADTVSAQDAMAVIRSLNSASIQRQLDAVAAYGMSLPSAARRYGIVGFCWGGGISFTHATRGPLLRAAVVFYGVSPQSDILRAIRAPVLGLYGSNDARVDATIAPADSVLVALGRTYVHNVYEGAGHGFLRQQSGMDGANLAAASQAWPATLSWLRKYLGS